MLEGLKGRTPARYSKYIKKLNTKITVCQGDSGGPLTVKSGGQHVLIGESSFGEGCGYAGKYGVYGRISFFRKWIERKMRSPRYCSRGPDAGF